MKSDNVAFAEAYLKAWDQRDTARIAEHLHTDVTFVGPMVHMAGRDTVMKSVASLLPAVRELMVRTIFAAGEQVMAVYDFICAEPIGVCRVAELMTFRDGTIGGIELFYDARPFEKAMQVKR